MPFSVFISYSHRDRELRQELEKHLVDQGKYEEAAPLYQRALAIYREEREDPPRSMTLLANDSNSAIRKPGHPQGDAPTIHERAYQATGYGRGDPCGCPGFGRCHARFHHLRHSPTESSRGREGKVVRLSAKRLSIPPSKATPPLDNLDVACYHLSMKQKRAYQYRFYPTSEQAQILARTFGCARYVYNWALRTDAYYQNQQRIGYHETSAQLTLLKKQTPWLNEVSSVPLQQALSHLDRAFRNFFEGRAEYPKFHKKQGTQSASYVFGLQVGRQTAHPCQDGYPAGHPLVSSLAQGCQTL